MANPIQVACVATLSALALAGSPEPALAEDWSWGQWQWGEFQARIDSLLSVSASIRTEGPDCEQIATVNGGCNPDATQALIVAGGSDALLTEGRLLTQDDGNLNYDQWDWFSVLVKGTHDLQLDWRNYGAFVRFTWFGDALQAQSNLTQRTNLSEDARFRDDILLGGVVGAHFLLLDAYLDGKWDVGERLFNVRVGNQVINWGESLFAQGGLNGVNTLDVTKIRLPGSELKEALLPAPFVKLGGDILPGLGFEAYYQFGWRKFELDPVGTFFSTNDLVSRGAEGQFNPQPGGLAPGCGDPGTSEANRNTILFCPPFPTLNDLTRFPNGIPFLGFEDASDQGQFGAALRYYLEAIETEFAAYYIRLHQKFPVVEFSASQLQIFGACRTLAATPGPGCDIGYSVVFPEDVQLVGLSFNTLVGGVALGGEVSYRWDQPTNVIFDNSHCSRQNGCVGDPFVKAGQQDLIDSFGIIPGPAFPGPAGGVVPGFTNLERIVAIANALYIISGGTPWIGWLPEFAGADDMTLIGEVAVTSYPDLDQCPTDALTPGCKQYARPLGADNVDDRAWGYTLRVGATYDRIFGTPISFLPVLAFSHDVAGISPLSEAGLNQGVMSLGSSFEFSYQQRWSFIISYSNTFGAGIRNGDADRDFLGGSLTYSF
jgi:hypothetical protein